MAEKFRNLRKPMFMAAAAAWVGYIFLAKGIGEGFMTVVLLIVLLMFMAI